MKIALPLFAIAIISFISCSKDTPTVAARTTEELLTAKTWKADEIRLQLSNNTTGYYKRGGAGNTVNYDSDSLKFNVNNTGIYYYSGGQTSTTWNFTNPEKTKMTIIVNYTTPVTLNLEYITLAESKFTYTQFSSAAGISYLGSGTRIPN